MSGEGRGGGGEEGEKVGVPIYIYTLTCSKRYELWTPYMRVFEQIQLLLQDIWICYIFTYLV